MKVAAALGLVIAAALGTGAVAQSHMKDDAASQSAALRAKLAQLRDRLEANAYGRPLHIDSVEAGRELRGDVHALVQHPFERLHAALSDAASWCDVLTLPFNVQRCEARGDTLSVFIGRKPDSPIEDATRLDLRFSVQARGDGFLRLQLAAPAGPAGTRDYRIAFAATPAGDGRTFVHFSYGYAHGTLSRLAMQAYFATSGAGKVGFTTNGTDAAGKPRLVEGMRGVTERNAMRYFLAIEAYLASLSAPPGERLRERLEHWFAATERYPRQLAEMSRDEYLALKTRASRGPRTASSSPSAS